MPTIIETKAFTFDELDKHAKERARDWYRELDTDFETEFMYDDFEAVAKILGIEFNQRETGKTRSGTPIYQPTIYWSGFCSQGDGACFEGTWRFRREALDEIKADRPGDTALHDIAAGLWPVRFGAEDNLWATVKHTSNHYYHENTVTIEVGDGDFDYAEDLDQPAIDQIVEALKDFCRWIYSQLEAENDWRYSAEYVDENINANEYLFEEDGSFLQ